MPLVAEVLGEGGATLADLDALGVGTGPGNFTGLRIAISAARGLSLALGCPAIGIPSHEAAAEGLPRPLLVSIDARRDRVYLQRFGPAARGPEIVARTEMDEWVDGAGHVTGYLAGALSAQFPLRPAEPTAPAVGVARAAGRRLASAPETGRLPRPAPLYLRPADAAPPSEAPPVLLP